MYKRKIYEFEEDGTNLGILKTFPLESDIVKTNSTLVLAIDKPDFIDQLSYDVNGIIIYSNAMPESENEEKQIGIPTVKIEIKDSLDKSLRISTEELLALATKGILSCLIGQIEFYLVAKVLEHPPDLISNISLLCLYIELDLQSNKKVFLIDNICNSIDGSLIEISAREDQEIFDMKIMCS